MSLNINILNIPLDGTGTEIPTLSVSDPYVAYLLTGTTVAIGNYAIVPTGTPQAGTIFDFIYDGTVDITTNGTTFALFGASFTQAQLLKKWTATCFYTGSAWEVRLNMNFLDTNIVATSNILDSNITTAKINNLAVTTGKLADDAVTTVKITDANITTAKIADDNVTNAKLANMNATTVKANITGSSANPTDVSIDTFFNTYGWSILGNSGTTAGTNFIGTTDNVDLVFKVNNLESGRLNLSDYNTSFGISTLISNVGHFNTAIGYRGLNANTTGAGNVAVGGQAMLVNTTGDYNTSIGYEALIINTTGSSNTALGGNSGYLIETGDFNTCIGKSANVSDANSLNRIALGAGATATVDYQFALPDNVTKIKWRGLTYVLPSSLPASSGVLTCDSSGNLSWV